MLYEIVRFFSFFFLFLTLHFHSVSVRVIPPRLKPKSANFYLVFPYVNKEKKNEKEHPPDRYVPAAMIARRNFTSLFPNSYAFLINNLQLLVGTVF